MLSLILFLTLFSYSFFLLFFLLYSALSLPFQCFKGPNIFSVLHGLPVSLSKQKKIELIHLFGLYLMLWVAVSPSLICLHIIEHPLLGGHNDKSTNRQICCFLYRSQKKRLASWKYRVGSCLIISFLNNAYLIKAFLHFYSTRHESLL